MRIKIFYSWQSDIPFNNQAIRDSLKLAIIDLEKEANIPSIVVVDSTSNLVGATHIPDSILQEIDDSDIFICDLAIIGKSDLSGRKIPNPNVSIELGYAVAKLSWNRMVVIFNEELGTVPIDIPFDIAKRSVLLVKIKDKNDTEGKGNLKAKLREWLKRIILETPRRPQTSVVNLDTEKRKHDIIVLKQFLKYFPVEDMDYFSKYITTIERDLVKNWEEFDQYLKSQSFFMYNEEGKKLLFEFHVTFSSLRELVKFFNLRSGRYTLIDQSRKNRASEVGIKQLRVPIMTAYSNLITFIRMNYLEIKFKKRVNRL